MCIWECLQPILRTGFLETTVVVQGGKPRIFPGKEWLCIHIFFWIPLLLVGLQETTNCLCFFSVEMFESCWTPWVAALKRVWIHNQVWKRETRIVVKTHSCPIFVLISLPKHQFNSDNCMNSCLQFVNHGQMNVLSLCDSCDAILCDKRELRADREGIWFRGRGLCPVSALWLHPESNVPRVIWPWGGSRILVRGPSGVLTPGGPEPNICLKLPENCMILKKKYPGPLDPLVCPWKFCLALPHTFRHIWCPTSVLTTMPMLGWVCVRVLDQHPCTRCE